MMSLVGGLIALLLGIIFLVKWYVLFFKGLMATLPILFIMGGALAAYLGYEELKDKTTSENFDEEATELKSEVESLKEEIKVLKDEKDGTEEKAE